MPVFRSTPYHNFNFLVSFPEVSGESAEEEVKAGFAEVSGLSGEVGVAEHRFGNAKVNYVTKVPGIHKAGDVTLKRGIIGATNLWEWLDQVRAGSLEGKRNVTIKLQAEDRSETVVSWKLFGAFPMKLTGPTLNGKGGGDVAMEELTLAVEHITQE